MEKNLTIVLCLSETAAWSVTLAQMIVRFRFGGSLLNSEVLYCNHLHRFRHKLKYLSRLCY